MNFYCLYRERQQELRTVTRNTNEGGGEWEEFKWERQRDRRGWWWGGAEGGKRETERGRVHNAINQN